MKCFCSKYLIYKNPSKVKRYYFIFYLELNRGLEFSSHDIELRNRVKQNDVTLRVTNSEIFIVILLSSYQLDFVKYEIKLRVTNSKVELLLFYFGVTNAKLKNK